MVRGRSGEWEEVWVWRGGGRGVVEWGVVVWVGGVCGGGRGWCGWVVWVEIRLPGEQGFEHTKEGVGGGDNHSHTPC